MELRIYLQILLKKWWIVLSTFLITFTATIVLTYTQTPVYKSVATYVIKPNTSFGDVKSLASGLDMLSRRTEIATTYAEVASSRLIRQEAAEELGLSQTQRKALSVDGQLLAGTNVIEIIAEGNDPDLVRDFADMVGAKMVVYVKALYETYDLKPLDEATRPTSPVKPNKMLNLALGAILGLSLGGGLAFLSEYLQAPLEEATHLSIFDNETGAYSKSYFRHRLREEMSRAKRNAYPLSLALMNVDQLDVVSKSLSPQARSEALRKVTVFLKQYLREEDILARLDETIFALMLPDVMEDDAKAMLEKLQTRIAWTPFVIEKSGVKLNLSSTAGVVGYRYNGTGQDEFLAEADRALRQAEASGYGKVCLSPGNGKDQSTQVE